MKLHEILRPNVNNSVDTFRMREYASNMSQSRPYSGALSTRQEASPQRALIPYRWELLIWLWFAFFLHQADRQVFGVILPLLKIDLGLTDVQCGLIASIFTAALGLAVPFAGYAGDVASRKWIVTGSLMLWSAATLCTGFGTTLLYLIVVRSVATAVGEACYAPSANALIGEQHVETRAQAMAIHQTALYIGIVFSGWLAGYLGQMYGWRTAFFVFGAAGLALAPLMAWRLQRQTVVNRTAQPSAMLVIRTVVRRPTVWLIGCGLGGFVFVNIGFLTWAPTYLRERFGLTLANAGFSSVFYYHVGSMIGVLIGGRLSDKLAPRRPVIRPEMQAAALLLGAPCLYLIGQASTLTAVYSAAVALGIFRGIYDSNLYAALFEVTEPKFHASAAALVIAVAFAIGAFAPVALGAAKQAVGLGAGLSALSVVFVLASAALFIAARFSFHSDRAKSRSV
jgi:MFS family permease